MELRDSRDPTVRKKLDYSGVVISLKEIAGVQVSSRPRHATMLQKDKMFSPHVLPISIGTIVDFPNADPIFHNAFSNYNGQIFDLGLYAPNSTKSVTFSREGVVRVFCNIHSSMSAVIVVLATPYFATTARDGSYEIPSIPPGDYQLSVFQERTTDAVLRSLQRRVTVENGPTTLQPIAISEAGFLPIPHPNKYGHAYASETDDRTIYPGARK